MIIFNKYSSHSHMYTKAMSKRVPNILIRSQYFCLIKSRKLQNMKQWPELQFGDMPLSEKMLILYTLNMKNISEKIGFNLSKIDSRQVYVC